MSSSSSLSNLFSLGSVSGSARSGGLVGSADSDDALTQSYSLSRIKFHNAGGALVGSPSEGTLYSQLVWSSEAVDEGVSAIRNDNPIGTSDRSLLAIRTGDLGAVFPGWDFTHVWNRSAFQNEGYPELRFVELDESPDFLKIFVTEAQFNGQFSSEGQAQAIARADEFCNEDENKPEGSAHFKALLFNAYRRACDSADCQASDAGRVDWPLQGNTAYQATGRRALPIIGTTNANGVFEFNLAAPVTFDFRQVWTGANEDWGVDSSNCSGFTSAESGNGRIGRTNEIYASAIHFSNSSNCSNARQIYCVEQAE
jgi:hypothetical protein